MTKKKKKKGIIVSLEYLIGDFVSLNFCHE